MFVFQKVLRQKIGKKNNLSIFEYTMKKNKKIKYN